MATEQWTLNLGDLPRSERMSPDPVFGLPRADGSLGQVAHYKVLKRLGVGGMGAVYLAQDEGLQRRVALKVMLPSAAQDATAKERFLREARTAAAIKHDNVVTIYQVGEDRGVPYIAMEFLAGAPLDRFLARQGRLTVDQVLRVGIEAAEGLAAAHALGLVHRDIKPANIWLEAPRGRVKILDFGIARQVDEKAGLGLTGAGTVVGTPGYMSPEQARGKDLDARSDLFSLGVVLYQLATGHQPFAGDSVMALLTALAVDDPAAVREVNPQIPPALETLVHRLLAKKPDHRPASAQAVADEIRAIALGPTQYAAQQTVPQVIYVPIAVAPQDLSTTEFAELGEPTEVLTERRPRLAPQKSDKTLWIIAGAVAVLALLIAVGVAASLSKSSKPADDVSAAPPPPVTPRPRPQPPRVVEPPKVEPPPVPPTVPTQLTKDDLNRIVSKYLMGHLFGEAATNEEQAVVNRVGFDFFATDILDDKGFEKLSRMPLAPFSTRSVEVRRPAQPGAPGVSDAGLAHLPNFAKMERLLLPRSDVTDAGAKLVAAIPRIHTIDLSGTRITDKAGAAFADAKTLIYLNVANTKFGDDGVKALGGLPELADLTLDGTPVTDAGLEALQKCPKLKMLSVKGTAVTAEGVKALEEALPELKVTRDLKP
jgi:serine/threonine protein kinase